MNDIITAGVMIVLTTVGLVMGTVAIKKNSDEVQANKQRYTTEIRETAKECLLSVRSNPQVQNFNDDNEIVNSCTEYALNLYGAKY